MNAPTSTVGFLGAGAIALALASRLLAAGCRVVLSNSRGPQSLHEIVGRLGAMAAAGTRADAAQADVTVLAVPWNRIADAIDGLPPWNGQIVIDTTNPLWPPRFEVADLGGRTSSEVVSDMLPTARLVKAFNTLPPNVVATDPRVGAGRRVIFVSGDYDDANTTVARLANGAGYAPVVLGSLRTGGALQSFPGGPLPTLNLIQT